MDDDIFWYEYDKLNAEITEFWDDFHREMDRIDAEYQAAKKNLLEGMLLKIPDWYKNRINRVKA